MKRYQMASTIRNMSKPLPPSRTSPQFVVRFPDEEMRDRIKQAAETNGRSMNAEIVSRLELTLSDIASTYGGAELKFAMMKVLRHEEFSLLLNRINTLGGMDRVLKESASALIKEIEGPSIAGTPAEIESHYSKMVGSTPLNALLTSEEIQKIAERLDQIQSAKATGAKTSENKNTPSQETSSPSEKPATPKKTTSGPKRFDFNNPAQKNSPPK